METILGQTSLQQWTFKVEVEESKDSNSIAKNSTDVKIEYFIGRKESDSYLGYPTIQLSASITGLGTFKKKYEPNKRIDIAGGKWHSMGSIIVTVPHDPDGRKTISLTASFTNDVSPNSGSASGTVKLTDIPRISSASFNSEFVLGDTVSFDINRNSESFTHKLYLLYAAKEYLIADGVDTSYHWDTGKWNDGLLWTIANNKNPNETFFGSIILYTFVGTVNAGRAEYPFTATVPEEYEGESIIPAVQCTLSPLNPYGIAEDVQDNYIATKTKIKANFSGSVFNQGIGFGLFVISSDGGKIYAESTDPNVFELETENALVSFGEQLVYAYVRDKSGRESKVQLSVVVDEYARPFVSTYSDSVTNGEFPIIERVIKNPDGTFEPSKVGTYLRVRAQRNFFPLENNVNKCEMTYVLFEGDDRAEIASGITIDANGVEMGFGSGENESSFVIKDENGYIGANANNSYTIQLTVKDSLGGIGFLEAYVPRAIPTFHAPKGGNGFALGRHSRINGAFECKYNAMFYGDAMISREDEFGNVDSHHFSYPIQTGTIEKIVQENATTYRDRWTYIVNSDGTAECWAIVTDEFYLTSSGNGNYTGVGRTIPFGLDNFKDSPVVSITPIWMTSGKSTSIQIESIESGSITIRHFGTTPSTETTTVAKLLIYAKGIWKNLEEI